MIIYLAASAFIAVYAWVVALIARLSRPHARLISRPRWQVRADGKHRIGQLGTPAPARSEIKVRVTAADWPPAPAVVIARG